MTIDTTTTFFAQRRARLRSALQPLITAHVLPAQVLTYIDQLYDRHRVFEAERIAGLALWLGKDRSTAWREICFEGFGTVLRATTTVVHGLAALDAQCVWESQKQSREAFVMACGLSLASLYPLVSARPPESDRGRRAPCGSRPVCRSALARTLWQVLADRARGSACAWGNQRGTITRCD